MVVRACPELIPGFHTWIKILRWIYRMLPLAPADHAASAIMQLDHGNAYRREKQTTSVEWAHASTGTGSLPRREPCLVLGW